MSTETGVNLNDPHKLIAKKKPKDSPVSRRVAWLFMAVLGASVVYPMLWVLCLSLKSNDDYMLSSPWALPKRIFFDNYHQILSNPLFLRYVLNSLLISVTTVVLTLIISSMAGYIVAKFQNRIVNFLSVAILGALMVPGQMVLMSLFVMSRKLGIINTPLAVIGPYVAFGIPFAMYLFRGFFMGIPTSLMEAAKIDGATELGVFFKIMLPLAKPAIATVTITGFIGAWNELLLALVLLQDQNSYTLPLGLTTLRGQYTANFPLQAAGLLMASLPALILYAVFNRTIIKGMVGGAVKG